METTNGSPATSRRSCPQWQAASRGAIAETYRTTAAGRPPHRSVEARRTRRRPRRGRTRARPRRRPRRAALELGEPGSTAASRTTRPPTSCQTRRWSSGHTRGSRQLSQRARRRAAWEGLSSAGWRPRHVGHTVSAARPAAEVTLPRERLQERSPAGAKPFAEVAESAPSADRRRELVSRKRPVLERATNLFAEDGQLPGRHTEVALPARPLPGSPRCNPRRAHS
jgi:hypothetical protein